MTTERPLPNPPISPSSPKISFPSSIRHDPGLRPNPHPYAIKTTTSALLTRSNSSGYNVEATHHYYVPLSPNANRSPEHNKGHKFSRSLGTDSGSPTRSSPRPLPVPPSFPSSTHPATGASSGTGYSTGTDGDCTRPRRNRRADTLPSHSSSEVLHPIAPLDDLPSNPKLWTPSQLSSYLTTALRVSSQVKSGESEQAVLPFRVAKDIAAFVKEKMINGRMFLKLNEDDLTKMGMNKKWRDALLAASQNLRQNVLKGRIWGSEVSPTSSPGSTSPLPMHVFSSVMYNSSSSSIDLSADEDDKEPHESRAKRYRNGRVRGMVETLERSGSFSSDGSFDGVDDRSNLRRWLREDGPVDEQPVRSPSPVDRAPIPVPLSNHHEATQLEEPTIEALLSESLGAPPSGSWGARAWEEMDLAPGVTVKRIVETARDHEAAIGIAKEEVNETIVGHGNGSGSGGGSARRGREERRVVTAIFTPISTSADKAMEHDAPNVERREEDAQTDAETERLQDIEKENLEETLKNEILITRALVQAFRKRLETVEQKIMELEHQQMGHEKETYMKTLKQSMEDNEGDATIDRERPAKVTLDVTQTQEDHVDSRPDPGSASKLLAQTSSLLPATLQRLNPIDGSFTGAGTVRSEDDIEKDDREPSSVSDLPSYVFLVGIGVCAIVLRVVLRRITGKAVLPGWRA